MDKATGVAEKDPARFSVDAAEIDRRKKWTSSTRIQVCGQCIVCLGPVVFKFKRGYRVTCLDVTIAFEFCGMISLSVISCIVYKADFYVNSAECLRAHEDLEF